MKAQHAESIALMDQSRDDQVFDDSRKQVKNNDFTPEHGKVAGLLGKVPTFGLVHSDLEKGAYASIGAVAVILILNIALGVVAATKSHLKVHHGLFTLALGTCLSMRHYSVWVHFLLNVLASVLLLTSNYFMQRLAAPTRQDVDVAHQHRKGLWIGSLSLTNFKFMTQRIEKFVLFGLLWASSTPIHLLLVPSEPIPYVTRYR